MNSLEYKQRPTLMTSELRVLALQSPQMVINAIAPDFERRTGFRIKQLLEHSDMPAHIDSAATTAFDVAFVVPAVLDKLAAERKIVASTRRRFLRVPIGVAVRAGAPARDIRSVAAFKRTLLDAKSIAYLAAGTSGPYLLGLFDRMGIAAAIRAKEQRPQTDTVGELVARGQAEIGITAIATLLATRGVDVIGPLPPAIQSHVVFQSAVSANSPIPDIAQRLIEFLTEPEALSAMRSKGMEAG